jgi:NAD+ synthase
MGMSGGIDSSVLAVLCYYACSPNILGVLMPCYSSQEDAKHALMVANRFSIPTKEIILDNVFDNLLRFLPDNPANPEANRLAKANLKVRLRTLTLYYLANQLSYLVAGASNKNEISVGYFTKYGDNAADIWPLGNLVKFKIRELATYLGIPKGIIEKPPTAGLWPGQTDEAELGFTYTELDEYLNTGKANSEVKAKIESLIAASHHKRKLPPIPNF